MSNKNHWFIIEDFDSFVNSLREIVFKSFGEKDNDKEQDIIETMISDMSDAERQEMNETLSFDECSIIVKSKAQKRKNKKQAIRYCINDNILMEIIEEINSRLISNILSSLVSKGMLDSAFDSDQNDFVFWIPDNDNRNKK